MVCRRHFCYNFFLSLSQSRKNEFKWLGVNMARNYSAKQGKTSRFGATSRHRQ